MNGDGLEESVKGNHGGLFPPLGHGCGADVDNQTRSR